LRFYRVRKNDVSAIEGSGLGLAIVKTIVEQHGGKSGLIVNLEKVLLHFYPDLKQEEVFGTIKV
jgi:K+-sensing histidine kinase KdpD